MVFDWPKQPTRWVEDDYLHVSVPFTWNLPEVLDSLRQTNFFWKAAIVGGPAVDLMPDFFKELPWVTTGRVHTGVLQRVNPLATRTSIGCIRNCAFCGVGAGAVESGGLVELDAWLPGPIICDNNLLACSNAHFSKVIDTLRYFPWCDFNQGLDARLLTTWHARLLAELRQAMCRLALDSDNERDYWHLAFTMLRKAGIPKGRIRTYVLVAFDDGPQAGKHRCEFVESHGVKALPQWFHALDALEANKVTERQESLGWTETKRKQLMGWYYRHSEKYGEWKDS